MSGLPQLHEPTCMSNSTVTFDADTASYAKT